MSQRSDTVVVRVLGAFLLASCVASVPPATATTREIPAQYSTIQAAVNAASNGDVVLLSPGVYSENLILSGKNITIASHLYTTGDVSYIDRTTIDGGGGPWVIRVDPSEVTLTILGLTLRNADDGVRATGKFNFLNNRVTETGDGIDYEDGGGGVVRDCVFEGNADDGIDVDHAVNAVIENNVIQNNGDDGIEIRLQPYSGARLPMVIRNNMIAANAEDGIQLISYDILTSRNYVIEGNLIVNNAMAGVGVMCCQNTRENYAGASLRERVGLYNNTFAGNNYGVTGGDSIIALNNIFVRTTNVALKRANVGSIAAYNLFFGNGTDYSLSNVDTTTTLRADPLLLTDYSLASGSPAIDAGTAVFRVNGQVVWMKPSGQYWGRAPDLGALENTGSVSVDKRGPIIEFLPPVPNPSRGPTSLRVNVSAAGHLRLEILDLAGRQVRLLSDAAVPAGRYDFAWDGRDAADHPVPASIYFAMLKTAAQSQTRRFVMLR